MAVAVGGAPGADQPLEGVRQHARPQGSESRLEAHAVSVGIMAYNEEANIAAAIRSLLAQSCEPYELSELIVIASGCTDRTEEIVFDIAAGDPRVKLIRQERREGKASAINLFIEAARSPLLLMVGADVILKDGALRVLLRHFDDPSVGMVGGRPIPVNDERTFLGYTVHLLWRLHDAIARESPKIGEVAAFRNVVPSIPHDTAVDEISIQALIEQLGYRLVYDAEAIVYNRGPSTLGDFLLQRRRIYAGHLRVRKQQGYAASTMSAPRVARAFLRSGSLGTPRVALWTFLAALLEVYARLLGRFDFLRSQTHHVWEPVGTTKRYIAEGVKGKGEQTVVVFHVTDFHERQLELGVRATRRFVDRLTREIQQALGPDSFVSVRKSGTFVSMISGDREEAERRARELVTRLEASPLRFRNGTQQNLTLTCGLVAFPRAGTPLAKTVLASAEERHALVTS